MKRHAISLLERFAFHHVAPVTGGIADRQAEWDGSDALAACKASSTPGVPIHRVVRMLEEIGTGFVEEPIGLRCRFGE